MFAVSHNRFGESVHHELKGMTKISALLAAASHCFISGGSVGQDDHSVIGRRVAIYGDAIESVFHGVIHGLIEAVLPQRWHPS